MSTSNHDVEVNGEAPPIEVKGLVSRFGDRLIHDGLDLTVRRGEIMGVVGGSGSGKTVLLKSLIGLKEPDGGVIRIFGRDLDQASMRDWDAIERAWGVLFQSGALFTNLTVKENVEAPMIEHTRLDKATIGRLANLKIVLAGLPMEAGALKPSELSGGMIKRAGLARALALDPQLLFLDEPTSGLDPIGAAAFDDLIAGLHASLNLTVFMITHDLDSLYQICDRVAVIADKKVVAIGPVEELERSDHPWVQQYFSGPRGRAAALAHTARGAS